MRPGLLAMVLGAGLLAACGPVRSPEAKSGPEFLPSGAPGSLPFSEAVRAGGMLYLSGQLGTDPETGRVVPGGIAAETRQALENIRKTLEKYGSSLDRVVSVTVMLTDMAEWAEMNRAYITFFPGRRPARNAFGAAGLALGARVEIVCVAAGGIGNLK